MTKQIVLFKDLGLTDYQSAWDCQEKLFQENVHIKAVIRNMEMGAPGLVAENISLLRGSVADTKPETQHYFLICEHLPVLTLGKSGHVENILISEQEMQKRGIQYYKTNRGGDITFHGPGQIVGYPILDLDKFYTDIGKYLRALEEVIILTMQEYGLKGERSKGETGVWMDAGIPGSERKICAMGVRCSRWVTMHGFALNVNTDLSYFDTIIPCGIENKKVTSLQKELYRTLNYEEVKQKVKANFEIVFGVELQ
ncbi:lipoyl(octanoyl) transferase LipB [Ferruginibacter paludis]|uniref:lipoyl(octanoyl) transferase LipB n=1 Tax=Ferruginibacter paludis TaxID=1310417 RepID=UPI0025B2C9C6|nr:lipoyl(octanoyl) transferase LipB [Ferruginibacter paludis]MDN3655007.1 lipoyl(octanoyl) transferase LipB [Ferruginibacter paludis]